jgi:hypothetical protein
MRTKLKKTWRAGTGPAMTWEGGDCGSRKDASAEGKGIQSPASREI